MNKKQQPTSPEYKAERAAYARNWRANNKEKLAEQYKRDWQKRKDTAYWEMLPHRYGITAEQYHAMSDKQGGVCAICGEKPNHRLRVDHCHKTGKVRGLLCNECNTGLGKFNDDISLLEAAIKLLKNV